MTSSETRKKEEPKKKRPRFWIGPLLAGSFFAFGYGLTNRLLSLQSYLQPYQAEKFEVIAFPGVKLSSLRLFYGAKRDDLLNQTHSQDSKVLLKNGDASSTSGEAIPSSTQKNNKLAGTSVEKVNRAALNDSSLGLDRVDFLPNPELIFFTPSYPLLRSFSLPKDLPIVE